MARMPLQLLIVEDRPDDAELLLAELRRAGYDPTWTRVETIAEFVAELAADPDVIVCDYSLPSMTAPDALNILRENGLEVPLIVVSGVMDEEVCVNSLRLGAVDYLLKDRLVRLAPAIEDAMAARRLAEAARTAGRERRETADILRGVVDHAPAAICVRDASGAVLLSNTEFDRLQPVGRGRPGGGPAVDRRRLSSVEQACLDGADKVQSEEHYQVDGEERTYLVVRYPVVDGTGRRFAVGAIYVDISPQKHVEQELRELDRFKDDFVATVSHELRTPLTSIFGYTEMLLAGDSDPMQRRMVEVIERNSRRLLSLVDDLLTLSRVDSGAFDKLDDQVDVADLVRSATSVLQPALEDGQMGLEIDLPARLPALLGNRSQLERVLLNLLSNAVKFSDPGGKVGIAVLARGDDLQLSISDTGMGIPPHEQAQVFSRFFRSTEARRRVIQGTGLGLAVVREIVERHRGTVEVQSTVGEGTTMTVTLPSSGILPATATPVRAAPAPSPASMPASMPAPVAAPIAGSGPTPGILATGVLAAGVLTAGVLAAGGVPTVMPAEAPAAPAASPATAPEAEPAP